MRTLWSVRLRPVLRSRDRLRSNTVPDLSRRSTSLRWQARLQFGDAFLILLVPVLTTALVVDVSWKSKRRKAWEDKIAEVQAEIESLHARRTERWLAYQHRTLRAGTLLQRRSYSTVAATVSEDYEDEGWSELQTWPQEQPPEAEQPRHNDHSPSMLEISQPQDLPYDRRRLVAVRFALELQIASRQIMQHDNRGSWALFPDRHVDLDTLVEYLKRVRNQYFHLCKGRRRYEPVFDCTATPGSQTLDTQIDGLSAELTNGRTSLPDFIQSVSTQIIQSKSSPGVHGYSLVLKILQQAGFHQGQQSLCYLVYRALLSSHVALDDSIVFQLLKLLGRNKDILHIDRLLHRLTKFSYPRRGLPSWHWHTADGIQLPVPNTGNPFLYCLLIDMALRCDQPQRAHVWRLLIPTESNRHLAKARIVGSFLHYHEARVQWSEGKRWLRDALELALDLGRESLPSLRCLVFNMLSFCVACRKSELYQDILDSAVKANIGVYQINPVRASNFTSRHSDILIEWSALDDQSSTGGSEHYRQDPGSVFHNLMSARVADLEESADVQAGLNKTHSSIATAPGSSSSQPASTGSLGYMMWSPYRRLNLDIEPQILKPVLDLGSGSPQPYTHGPEVSLQQTHSAPIGTFVPMLDSTSGSTRPYTHGPDVSLQQIPSDPIGLPLIRRKFSTRTKLVWRRSGSFDMTKASIPIA